MKSEDNCFLAGSYYDKPRQCGEKQKHYSVHKGPYSQGYGIPSGHVWLWELDHKEGRMPKNWYLQTVVLEKTLESPLDSKEIKPVSLKGNQPWILIGKTDAEVETPVFWSCEANSRLIGKVPEVGKDWGQEKGASNDEMGGWHHPCNGHELGQIWEMVRDREAWQAAVHRVTKSDTTGQLNKNKNQNVTMAATGVVQAQLREHWQAKLEEAKKGLFPVLLEEAWPWLHFDFAFLPSRPVTEYLFIVLSYIVCGNLLQQPNTKDIYKTNKQNTQLTS